MSEHRSPVELAIDLETLDADEIFEGYRDGLAGEPCGDNRSRSYWHGWRNGMVDSKRTEKDGPMAALAHAARQMGGHDREEVMSVPIFTFGSNLAGRHGKGAALWAMQHRGAMYGKGVGLHGDSYAIPTKDRRLRTLPLADIEMWVGKFLTQARQRSDLTFQLTPIGCGLAGYKPEQIAPMFRDAPPNVLLPDEFKAVLEADQCKPATLPSAGDRAGEGSEA